MVCTVSLHADCSAAARFAWCHGNITRHVFRRQGQLRALSRFDFETCRLLAFQVQQLMAAGGFAPFPGSKVMASMMVATGKAGQGASVQARTLCFCRMV